MLSICVPVYNYDVTELVSNLLAQLKKNAVSSEIILIDDASETEFQESNKQLSKSDNVNYFQLDRNIGRAKIRNLFLSYINYDYMLFLDCDSQITDNKFIENYLTQIVKKHKVICGGRSYPLKVPSKTHYLRWKYGLVRECLPSKRREEKPHRSFMTNNFVIHKKVLSEIPFDERLTQYGHEDTLFGFRLKQNKISVIHIDNPVQHLYTENNVEFLQKTEIGLINLIKIRKFINNKEFDKEIKIIRIYKKISPSGMKYLFALIYFLFAPLILRFLKNNIGGLYLFDFYKLLLFTKLTNKEHNN